MSIRGLYLHNQKVARRLKSKNHPSHFKPNKEQKENRKARVEYNRKKVAVSERERATEEFI